jgi:rhamnulose-1-phosphate aldolase
MALTEPLPSLEEIFESIGAGGLRLAAIDATEGAAGNISVCIGWPIEVRRQLPMVETIELPVPAPHLVGHTIIVTGSGRRLRDLGRLPKESMGAVVIDADGTHGTLHTAAGRLFETLTSEWNSHLAVHDDTVARSGTNFHAVVHAQPPNMVYLSHIPEYRDPDLFTRRLLRWQPETIVQLPRGIGILPFMLPSSNQLMAATVEGLRRYRIVVWSKHGVMARSDQSVTRAVDRIEYAEAGARYEYMDLVAGGRGEGLTREESATLVAGSGSRPTCTEFAQALGCAGACPRPEGVAGGSGRRWHDLRAPLPGRDPEPVAPAHPWSGAAAPRGAGNRARPNPRMTERDGRRRTSVGSHPA